MADKQDEPDPKQIPDSVSGEIDLADVMYVEAGRTSGPPQARTKSTAPKQWEPPKNESAPNKRAKKT